MEGSIVPNQSIPLTLLQKLWVLENVRDNTSPLSNIGGVCRTENIDIERFYQSVCFILDLHPSFKARFLLSDYQELGVEQVLTDACRVNWTSYDLSDMNKETAEQEAQAIIRRGVETPLDLFAGESFRTCSILLPNDQFIFAIVVHHAIADGVSLLVAVEQMLNHYYDGIEPVIQPLELGMFAKEEQRYIQSSRMEKDKQFWSDKLRGKQVRLLKPKTQDINVFSEQTVIHLDRNVVKAWEQSLFSDKIALPTAFLSLWWLFLIKTYKPDDNGLCIGLPVHNRTKGNWGQVNSRANLLIHYLSASTSTSFRRLCQQINTQVALGYRHSRFPPEFLYEALDLDLNIPLCEFRFNYLAFNPEIEDFNGQLQFICHNQHRLPLQLTVINFGSNATVDCLIDYNLSYFDADEITMLASEFRQLFESVLGNYRTLIN